MNDELNTPCSSLLMLTTICIYHLLPLFIYPPRRIIKYTTSPTQNKKIKK